MTTTAPTTMTGKHLRVALTCSGLSHVRRGVEAWSQEAFDGLRARGVDVELFKGSGLPAPSAVPGTGQAGAAQAGANGVPGVRVVPCIRRDSTFSRQLTSLLPRGGWRLGIGSPYQAEQTSFAVNAFWAIRHQFDLLHTKDPQVAWLFHRAHRLGLSRPKVILNHGTEEPPEFLNRFDFIQHLAPAHLEEARLQGVGASHQFVVPNFVDTERFCPGRDDGLRGELGIPADALVVTSVAAIKRHHKRIDWLLREMEFLAKELPELYLVVAGARTDDTGSLLGMARELLGDRVRFLVDFPRAQMPRLYRASDVFVLCSHKEMLSNALLEALATGLPCVASVHPVNRWAVGEGGQLVETDRPGAVADAVASYRLRAVREAVGVRARAQALEVFAKDAVLARQIAMYRTVGEAREQP